MTMRISTSMLYQQSISTMLAKQAKLAHTQLQLSSGQRLITAKDDPVAAGVAVGLDRSVAELARFAQNGNALQNRLGLQESVLAQVGDAMARVSELALQANNATLGNDSRHAISTELKAIRTGLLDLANSTDGAGRYLFGGTADGSPPFSLAAGGVVYAGDQTQRRVEVAPDTFLDDTLPGSEVFLRLRVGDGRVDARAAAGNTGTGLLMDFGLSNSSAYSGATYSVVFTTPDTYEVRDANSALLASGPFIRGESISFGGVRIELEGAPATGDSFQIGAADTRDVFATVQGLVDALEADPTTGAQRADMQNRIQGAIRDVAMAQNRMIDARAGGGAMLLGLDNAAELREANAITLKQTLSGLRDLDYAEAIGRYNLENTALQAAQTVFMQMQSLSLFKLLR